MIYDGIQLVEGSSIQNASVASGTTFPGGATTGELFFRTDEQRMYVYDGAMWDPIASSTTVTGNTAANALTGTTLASNVVASSLTSVGTITSGTWSAGFGAVSGANLTNLNATALTTGTVNPGRLGSGLANATSFLRGDGVWTSSIAGDASALTGTTLASGVVNSSLTSVGILTGLTASGNISLTSPGITAERTIQTSDVFGFGNGTSATLIVRAGSTGDTVGGRVAGDLILAGGTNSFTGQSGNVIIYGGGRESTYPSDPGSVIVSINASADTFNSSFEPMFVVQTNGGQRRFQINNAGAIGLSGANYGTAGQFLVSNGVNTPPSWGSVSSFGSSITVSGTVSANDPTLATHLTTKSYVDQLVQGLSWKNTAVAATTANITLSGTQTVDGVALVAGNRVLVKNQSTATQNGVYVVAVGAWSRAADFDGSPDVGEVNGAAIYVTSGTTNGDTAWTQTTEVVTVGSQAMNFSMISGGAVNASSLLGTTLASNVVNSSLTSVGTITSGTWSGSFGSVSGANLTNLNASNLATGTVATARLGTGTANNTTFLRGDGVWTSASADASTLTGTTLASNVVSSSLTSVGTLSALTVSGLVSLGGVSAPVTLAGSTDFSRAYTETRNNVAAAATTSINAALGNVFVISMGASITSLTFSNLPSSSRVYNATFFFVQDGTGNRTITWPASFRWAGGNPAILSTGANKTDIITAVTYDNGATWFAMPSGINF